MRRIHTHLLLITFAAASHSFAHDLWLEPSSYQPKIGDAITVSVRVGEHFAGESVERNNSRIERFVMLGSAGERPVIGKDGDDPAGMTRASVDGCHALGYVSSPVPIELDAGKFESYLKEEGLERIIEDRAARGESGKPGRELYSRSVKSLIRVGSTGSEGFDRALALPLELIPEQNPYDLKPGDKLACRLLLRGQPLKGALVDAIAASNAGKREKSQSQRTDEKGRVAFTLDAPGAWLLTTTHMERADDEQAEWRSTWSSLTFEIPAPGPASDQKIPGSDAKSGGER